MQSNIKLVFVTAGLSFLCPSVRGQAYQWQQVSPSDAIQMVRTFEANAALQVTISRVPDITSGDSPNIDVSYLLNSGQNVYRISAYTKDSFIRYNPDRGDVLKLYGSPYNRNALAARAITKEAAQSIAFTYLSSHYPAPQLMTRLRVEPHAVDQNIASDPVFVDSYRFYYSQDCGSGIYGPSQCQIEVNTVTSQIVYYKSSIFPVLISAQPSLTASQAVAMTANTLQLANVQMEETPWSAVSQPDAFGNERLRYHLVFSASPLSFMDDVEDIVATVDANDGTLISWYSALNADRDGNASNYLPINGGYLKADKRLKAPIRQNYLKFAWHSTSTQLNYMPLLINDNSYMYTGYLSSGAERVDMIITDGKRIIINGRKRKIDFALNSQSYTIDGKAKQMSTKPILINDRCYVPLDVMQTVLGGKWSFDAKTQTVRYDPPQKKVARN